MYRAVPTNPQFGPAQAWYKGFSEKSFAIWQAVQLGRNSQWVG
jgi:hypothetical protein